jgi:hypothetical protein
MLSPLSLSNCQLREPAESKCLLSYCRDQKPSLLKVNQVLVPLLNQAALLGSFTFMEFFIPDVEDGRTAEGMYQSIRKFNTDYNGAHLSARRIYCLRGTHDGQRFTVAVGQRFERLQEKVLAILFDDIKNCYLICTPNRGAIGDVPYLSGQNEVIYSEDFEGAP